MVKRHALVATGNVKLYDNAVFLGGKRVFRGRRSVGGGKVRTGKTKSTTSRVVAARAKEKEAREEFSHPHTPSMRHLPKFSFIIRGGKIRVGQLAQD